MLMQRYVRRELGHPLLVHKAYEELGSEEDRELLQEVRLLLRDYWPHPLLEFSGAVATTWSALWAMLPTTVHPGHIEELRLEDGGTISLHWSQGPQFDSAAGGHKGIVLLMPGLNNDSRTSFVQSSMKHILESGYHAVAFNTRGTGGLQLTSPRIGCADAWRDLNSVVDHLERVQPGVPIYAMGFSMGGAILLRYCGEEGDRCRFKGVVTIAAPMDLNANGAHLEASLKKCVTNFAMTNGAKLLMFQQLRNPLLEKVHLGRALAATSLRGLEEAVICPLHGYENSEDYYWQNNPRPHLRKIAVPTLVVNAADDPVVGFKTLPQEEARSNPNIFLAITRRGGHIGWGSGGLGDTAWTDHMAVEFIQAVARRRRTPRSRL